MFGDRGTAALTVTSFFLTSFGVMGNLLVLTFLSLYLAADAGTYTTGLLRLVPMRNRSRAGEVLGAIGYHLRWWLFGRFVAMLVVGVVVGVGLGAVGLPQFLVLALIAALLNSVPYLGPILAAVPGLLLALIQGPDAVLRTAIVYLLSQSVDNYLVTPLVQQKTVDMPPVLSILAVVLGGVLFGILGLLVSSPLVVVMKVAIQMLYVEDVLGDTLEVPGADRPPELPHPVTGAK